MIAGNRPNILPILASGLLILLTACTALRAGTWSPTANSPIGTPAACLRPGRFGCPR